MATNPRRVRVEGLRELSRAFAVAGDIEQREFRKALREAADPVKSEAEALAATQIRNLHGPWSGMRIGVTRTSVYVAPKQRTTRNPSRKRKNLASLLLGRAMLPALEHHVDDTEERVDEVLTKVARGWERA